MKILFYCSGGVLSGKEFVDLEVIEICKKAGHEVEVIFGGWNDGKFQQKLNEQEVPNYPIKLGWYYLSKPKWSLDSLLHYPAAVMQFKRIYKRFAPDVLYVDSYRPLVLLKPFLDKNVIYHIHDPIEGKGEKQFLNFIQQKVLKFVSVSNFIAESFIANGVAEDAMNVVHNGVKLVENISRDYLPDGKIRIGLVGQILPRKGHHHVLEACAQIKDKITLELYIYGSGQQEYINTLKDSIEKYQLTDRVHWMGFENDKAILYNNIDVLLAPTINDEPFALVALEAGLHKVPVIATISGGFPESIIDNVTGYLVNKSDPAMIADRLLTLCKDKKLIENMGKNARGNITSNFTREIFESKMLDLLSQANITIHNKR